MARSDKMYGDSPMTKRDESGKVSVTRASKEKKPERDGPKHDMGTMAGRHMRELSEMHKRHMAEHKAMNDRQEKEAEAEAQQPTMPADGAAPAAGAPAGAM